MPRKIVTVTHPDGTKKVIVGKQSTSQPIPSNSEPVKTRQGYDSNKRAKPIMGKAGLTSTRTAYKKGGKINVGKR